MSHVADSLTVSFSMVPVFVRVCDMCVDAGDTPESYAEPRTEKGRVEKVVTCNGTAAVQSVAALEGEQRKSRETSGGWSDVVTGCVGAGESVWEHRRTTQDESACAQPCILPYQEKGPE